MVYPISAGQIKAARALLDWSQEDLAEAANVSISTIRTTELGKIPRPSTLLEICETIQRNGLEFTEGEGVKRRDLGIVTMRGADSCNKFFDDIHRTIKQHDRSVLVFTKSPIVLTQKCGIDRLSNLNRLEQIHKISKVRCLLTGITQPPFAAPTFECRTSQQYLFGSSSCFIYGDKCAHLIPEDNQNFMVIVFYMTEETCTNRQDFFSLWKTALPVQF